MRRIRSLALAAMLVACSASTPELDASLTIALGQSSASIVLMEIGALQGGEIVGAEVDTERLEARLHLRAGIPAVITASLLGHDSRGLLPFRGVHSFTPAPGPSSITLDVLLEPGRTGKLVPTFTGGHELLDNVPFDIRDDASGTVVGPFMTRQSIVVPDGRDLTFVTSYRGVSIETPLAGGAPFAVNTPLAIGAGPSLPSGPPLDPAHAWNLGSGLVFDPAFNLECAVAESCDAAAPAAWGDCATVDDGIVLGSEQVEGDYPVVARYVEAPSLCNDALARRYDFTPPRFEAELDPPYLVGTDDAVTLRIESAETLDPASIALTASGSTADLCDAVGEGLSFTCTVSGLATRPDTQTFQLSAADPAGNTFDMLLSLQRLPSTPGVYILGPVLTGAGPDSSHDSDHVGLRVKNVSGLPVDVSVQSLSVQDAVGALLYSPLPSPPGGPGSAHIEDGGVATLWSLLTPMGADVPAGDYAATATLSDNTAASFTLQVVARPLRWATAGELRLPVSPPAAELIYNPPVSGGRGRSRLYEYRDETGAIVDLLALRSAPSAGRLLIDVVDPNSSESSRNRLYVDPGSELLVLQAGGLARRAQDGATTSVPLSLQGGKQVLWEPRTDSISVIGSRAVELLGGNPPGIIDAPCGADAILGATVLPPRLVLLVSAAGSLRHCEIDPAGDVAAPPAVDTPLPAGCAATRIVANPLSGTVLAAGAGCAVSYRVSGGRAVDEVSRSSPGLAEPPAAIAIDPIRGTVFVAGATSCAIEAWGTDPALRDGTPLAIQGCMQAGHAIAVDPLSGRALATAVTGLSLPEAKLLVFPDRFAAAGMPTEGPLSNADPAVVFSAVAIDATQGRIYLGGRGGTSALYGTLTPGGLIDPLAFGNRNDVLDLALAGPQPLFTSTRHMLPGDAVTVTGLGFAGDGSDEVYVHGVRAELIAFTAAALTFVVPPVLAALERTESGLWISVRSHGRMSGPVPGAMSLIRESPTQVLDMGSPGSACSGACQPVALLPGPASLPVVQSIEELAAIPYLGGPVDRLAAPAPASAVGLPAGRVIGTLGTDWLDQAVPDYYVSYTAEPAHLVPATLTASAEVAVDASGTLLAVADSGAVTLYSALDLARLDPPLPLSAPSADALAFGSRRDTIVAAAGGVFIGVHTSGAPLAQSGGCGPYDRLLALGRAGRDGELAAVVESAGSVALRHLYEDGQALTVVCDAPLPLAGTVRAAVISPLGRHVALAIEDAGATQIYLVGTGDPVVSSRYLAAGPAVALAFSADGTNLFLLTAETPPSLHVIMHSHAAALEGL